MTTTRRKRKVTSKNTASPLTKDAKPSTTRKSSSISTQRTARLAKTASKPLDEITVEPSSLSSSKAAKTEPKGSSLRAALQDLKRRSIEDRQNGGSGFVRVTSSEHGALTKAFGRGRPAKDPQDVAQVRSLRVTPRNEARYQAKARSQGFPSWQAWAQKVLDDAASD